MKKVVVLLIAVCLCAGFTSCTKMCKCTYWRNGSEDTTKVKPFERALDKVYDKCSSMSDFNEATQTGAKCK